MTQKYTLNILITEDGTIEAEVEGVTGPICEVISAWLDDLGKVEVDKKTPDYDRRDRVQQQTRLRAGAGG